MGETSLKRLLNPRLWPGYCEELTRSASTFRTQIAAGEISASIETLHAIQATALVVPVDEIVEVTHLLANLLDILRCSAKYAWPGDLIDRYLKWLDAISLSGDAPELVLSQACELQLELADTLTRLA